MSFRLPQSWKRSWAPGPPVKFDIFGALVAILVSDVGWQFVANIITGWWCNNHLEKWWSESQWEWEGWHPIYEMENKRHVWNHQPESHFPYGHGPCKMIAVISPTVETQPSSCPRWCPITSPYQHLRYISMDTLKPNTLEVNNVVFCWSGMPLIFSLNGYCWLSCSN